MKKLYFFLIFAILAGGIFLILKFGTKPQPVGIMKPSYFTAPHEIGAVVFRRFYVPIEDQRLVVFGVPMQPQWHHDIIRGFLGAAEAEKRPFDVLIFDEAMPSFTIENHPNIERLTVPLNSSTQGELVDLLEDLRARNKRALLVTASVFSTHILAGNPINRFEAMTGERVFSITSAPLALRPDQEHLVDPPCIGSVRDQNGTSDLGCAILSAGRRLYRKNIAQDRYVAIMQQNGAHLDYLLLISAPGQDQQPQRQKSF